jgi:hypothetical protein
LFGLIGDVGRRHAPGLPMGQGLGVRRKE